jgi:hypothetical protein
MDSNHQPAYYEYAALTNWSYGSVMGLRRVANGLEPSTCWKPPWLLYQLSYATRRNWREF